MDTNDLINSYKSRCLSFEEESRLIRSIQDDGADSSRARERLIEANIYYAGVYARNFHCAGVPLEDLWSSANEGLLQSISSYDASLGVPFHKYAEFRMKTNILDNIGQNGNKFGPLPLKVIADIKKLRKTEERLIKELGAEPSLEELAYEMNISEEDVKYLMRLRPRFIDMNDERTSGEKDETDSEVGTELTVSESAKVVMDEKTVIPKKDVSFSEILPPFDYEVFVRSRGLDGFKEMNHRQILEDINRIRSSEGKKQKTMEDVSIHYSRAVLLDRCFD